MKLTIEQPHLVHLLTQVASIVEKRNTMPILANVLLKVSDDAITATATDLDIEVTANSVANVESDGSTTVNADTLVNIVKKLPKGSQVSLELIGVNLHINAGKSHYELATLDAGVFPVMATDTYENSTTIEASVLAGMFARTAFAMSTEETRYYLNGVYLHNVEGDLVAVATDGHRLAKSVVSAPHSVSGVIVPRKTVVELRKLLSEGGDVVLDTSETKMRVKCGDFTLVSKVVDGSFPDYTRVIPSGNNRHVGVDAKAFRTAIDRVVTVSDDRSKAVNLTVSSGKIVFEAKSGTGSAVDEIEAEYSGEEFEAGFNSKYLNEIASQAENGGLNVSFGLNSTDAALITPDAYEGTTFVQMGMRI